jgi:protein-tyrosine phosphatase
MQERGLDISGHRSRVVKPEVIHNSDLILTMESGQAEALKVDFKQVRDKVYLLTELVGIPYDIEDPFRRGKEAFEATATELAELLDSGIGKILALARGAANVDTGD